MTRNRARWVCALSIASSLAWPTLARAERVTVEQASADQRRAAQKTFEAGDELYEAGSYAEALTAFRASHDLVASPNSRLMVARCLRELGRLGEAFREFDGALDDAEATAGRYAETVAAARSEREALRPHLGLVRVKLPEDPSGVQSVSVGNVSLGVDDVDGPIAVDPGTHSVIVVTNGDELHSEVTVGAGETKVAEFGEREPVATPAAFPPAPASKPAQKTRAPESTGQASVLPWVALGVGAIGMGGFVYFGQLSNERAERLQERCPDGMCAAAEQSTIDEGRRYQWYANTGLALGVMGLGGGAALLLFQDGESERGVVARVSPRAVWVSGNF